ncbi:MAG: helix-turn-helix domain-containing protein [Ruminococcus flavefaciens]|nr:helix-turn-helix domain-containing protein [Ruminococcus flavefaciens]
MKIGQVIRKYRKEKDMTQEEMANRLGVTAPAVNKWENGGSMPDIMLLAPIARLLGISLDVLLSFREELTEEEIQDIIYTLNDMLREGQFAEGFRYAKEKIAQYPNCEPLFLEAAVLLNAERLKRRQETENRTEAGAGDSKGRTEEGHGIIDCVHEGSEEADYDAVINGWFKDALHSEQEQIRTMAADALFAFYLNGGQYEEAEACLAYYSAQNPERKRKQAWLYGETGRTQEAYQTYETLLLDMYGLTDLIFHSIGALAAQEQDMDRVRAMADKQSALAALFEMGEYHRWSGRLELAVLEQDVEATITIMQRLLASVDEINQFTKSSLFAHMSFREIRPEYMAQVREDLLKSFRNEEAYGFLRGDSRWEALGREAESGA